MHLHDTFSEKTMHLFHSGASVQVMLDSCAEAAGAPMLMADLREEALCFSVRFPVDTASAFHNELLKSAAMLHAPDRAENAAALSSFFPEGFYIERLRYGNAEIGFLLIAAPVTEQFLRSELYSRIKSSLSVCAFANGWESALACEDSSLRDLFSKAYLSKVELKRLLQPFGLFDTPSHRLLFFMVTKEAITNELLLNLRRLLQELSLPFSLCVFQGVPIVLTDGSISCNRSSALYEALLAFSKKYGIHAFVSGRFSDIMQAKDKLRHCRFLMECVTSVTTDVVLMDDFNTFGLLLASELKKSQLTSFCSETLLDIVEYDEQNGTEYLKTLRSYLVFNRNAKEAGAALFIHPNTVLYRIRTMQERFSFDLNDTTTVFSFTMSLYIMLFLGWHDPI